MINKRYTCEVCGRAMRDQGRSARDYPGTITRASGDVCSTCYNRISREERAERKAALAEASQGGILAPPPVAELSSEQRSVVVSAAQRVSGEDLKEVLCALGIVAP